MTAAWRHLAAALCLLGLPLLASACLHWVPEEELEPGDDDVGPDDDDVAPDDDDVGPDDDDVAPDDDDVGPDDDDDVPLGEYEANAAALVLVWDDAQGVDDGRTVAAALFNEELLSPSAEEAMTESVFGISWPLFAEPGESRYVQGGGHYEVEPVHVGEPLFVNSGPDSLPLVWTGTGYRRPDESMTLPALLDGADWVLQVPADGAGFGGFHGGPRLPGPAKPEFERLVGDRVHLLAGQDLSGQSSSVEDAATDLLIVGNAENIGATAFHVADGGVTVTWPELPVEIEDGGQTQLTWYRAARRRIELDGGPLMLVTGRWTQLRLLTLPEDVAYAWTDPVELPRGEPTVFTVQIEDVVLPPDSEVQVVIGTQTADQATVTNDHLVVSFTSGLLATGTHDMVIQWEGGAAAGSAWVTAEPIPCGMTESEPNDAYEVADFFVPGGVVCGTIDPPSDLDTYRFTASAGGTYTFEILANRVGLPTDSTLTLLEMDGNTLAVSDDEGGLLDSLIVWTAPAPGQYLLQVASFQNQSGGPDHGYQLLTSQ